MHYKAIMFDFYGVICMDLYWSWLSKNVPHFAEPEKQKHFSGLADLVDGGKMSSHDFYEIISKDTGIPMQEMLANWQKEISVNKELLDIITVLKQKYKTAILSNSSGDFLNQIVQENGLQKHFNQIFISAKIGLIKPQPEIFRYALEKLGVEPEESIFTDDREINVNAAKELGIDAFQFTNNLEFKKQLGLRGIVLQ